MLNVYDPVVSSCRLLVHCFLGTASMLLVGQQRGPLACNNPAAVSKPSS